MNKYLLVLIASTLSTTAAYANTQAKKALSAISQQKIEKDLKQAITEGNFKGDFNLSTDYIVCLKDSNATCTRHIDFELSFESTENTKSIVLSYDATIDSSNKVSIELNTRDNMEKSEVDRSNSDIVLAAIKELEKDYPGEGPIRSAIAGHPHSVKVITLSSHEDIDTENEENTTSDEVSIVSFTESGYSRVVGWVSSQAYVVRKQTQGTKNPVITVKKLVLPKI